MSSVPLWTVDAMAQAMGTQTRGLPVAARCRIRSPASRSTAAASGAARRSSRSRATPATAMTSCRRRSPTAPVSRLCPQRKRDAFPKDAPLLVVPDVLEGLRALARAARARSQAKVIARHRLGRQDQHQGSAAACARAVRRDACVGRLLQQSLGRAAVARALPRQRALCGVRDGHEPCRRDRAAVALVRPHVAIITTIAPVHLEYLRLDRGYRRRQGGDLPWA